VIVLEDKAIVLVSKAVVLEDKVVLLENKVVVQENKEVVLRCKAVVYESNQLVICPLSILDQGFRTVLRVKNDVLLNEANSTSTRAGLLRLCGATAEISVST